MGTNFYFMSRDKDFVQAHFAKKCSWGVADEEYSIVDEPYLGYEVHLNKLSIGWRPIFQRHKAFETFNQLKEFYFAHKDKLDIYDEYGTVYEWNDYYDRVYRHSLREREPVKWVYEIDEIFNDKKPTLHTVRCSEEEAELHIPFEHCLYEKTEREAARRFGVVSPRTCGNCLFTETAWWALVHDKKQMEDLSNKQKETIQRILNESNQLLV